MCDLPPKVSFRKVFLGMEQKYTDATIRLIKDIKNSPTAFQAVDTAAAHLVSAGFVELSEKDAWTLAENGKYFVRRNGSSIIAFRMPANAPAAFMISASHTDSPTFKLKNEFEAVACDRYLKLCTEPYGGTIFSSWLDRPLSVAGRAIVKEGDVFTAKSVVIDRDLLVIPNVAIHMNRTINSGFSYNAAVDLQPLLGAKGNASPHGCRTTAGKRGIDRQHGFVLIQSHAGDRLGHGWGVLLCTAH